MNVPCLCTCFARDREFEFGQVHGQIRDGNTDPYVKYTEADRADGRADEGSTRAGEGAAGRTNRRR